MGGDEDLLLCREGVGRALLLLIFHPISSTAFLPATRVTVTSQGCGK